MDANDIHANTRRAALILKCKARPFTRWSELKQSLRRGGLTKMQCPFCGERENLHAMIEGAATEPRYFILCGVCEATGPRADSSEECDQLWNQRSPSK